MVGIKEILVGFFFGYWIVHDTIPFSIWWIILIYIGVFLFETILASIFKETTKKMSKTANEIKDTINGFERRLNRLEKLK